MKTAVVLAPCLAGAINPAYPIFGRTDASIIGVAAVLFQFLPTGAKDAEGNDILRPKAIAFASRRFSPTEFRWTVNDKEAYSLKFFFEKFVDLVQGYDIHLQTDHRNSLWLSSSASPKVIRWRLFMNRWSFKLSLIPGRENGTSDALSRKVDELDDDEFDAYLSRLHISNMQVPAPSDAEANDWRGDPQGTDFDGDEMDQDLPADFHAVLIAAVCDLEKRERCSTPTTSSETVAKFNSAICAAVSKADALLAPVSNHPSDDSGQYIDDQHPSTVPQAEILVNDRGLDQSQWTDLGEEELEVSENHQPVPPEPQFVLLNELRQVHSDSAGHVGALKTYRRLRVLQSQPWDLTAVQIQAEVSRFIAACPTYQKAASFSPPPGSDRWIRKPPFRELSIDVLEMPFPDSDGNTKILVVIDSFSRALELFPLPFADAMRVAECLYAIYCRYYRTEIVRCDNAKAFVGSVVKQLLTLLGSQVHSIDLFAHWQTDRSNVPIAKYFAILERL